MKTLKRLATISVLASSAFAQAPGFFISGSGGIAQTNVENFTVFNAYYINIPSAQIYPPPGETLSVTDKKSSESVARLSVGYPFNKSWDIRFSYADYGTATAKLQPPSKIFLTYSPIATFVPTPFPAYNATLNAYQRLCVKFRTSEFTLLPTYSYAIGRWKLRAGAGLSLHQTSSHFETTFSTFDGTGFRRRGDPSAIICSAGRHKLCRNKQNRSWVHWLGGD
jgi:hypothetical protein